MCIGFPNTDLSNGFKDECGKHLEITSLGGADSAFLFPMETGSFSMAKSTGKRPIHLIENEDFRQYFAAFQASPVTKYEINLGSYLMGQHLVLNIFSKEHVEVRMTITGSEGLPLHVSVDGSVFWDLEKLSFWLQSSGEKVDLEVVTLEAMDVRGFFNHAQSKQMWAAKVQIYLKWKTSIIEIGDFVSSTAHALWPAGVPFKDGFIDVVPK